ncbi:DUF4296 domain-containing protein [Flammeovirgaceae bacterium SG7u.111]|nr:DUF4296 domain-containing protein [Flammeovirgaceae bacterium SG7u.132]WPO34469.1 DUF4296 domain-containing protein [Flammeovirgaceae bacterium SG7u.111]
MKKIGFFLLLVSLVACDKNKLPKGVIPKDQMIDVTVDMQMLESKVDMRIKGKEEQKAYFTALQNELYKKHGIDSAIYTQSFDYYMNRLADSRDIFKAVNDSIDALRDEHRDKAKEKTKPNKPIPTQKK